MKRYWLFANEEFYPNGGMRDFKGDFGSVEEAEEKYNQYEILYWFHIYDSVEDVIVKDEYTPDWSSDNEEENKYFKD